MKYVFLVPLCLVLSGCFAPLIGLFPSMGVSVGSNVISHKITGKGLSDHALSEATGKDCHLGDAVTKLDICKDPELPPLRTESEIIQFQRDHELEETGVRDEITMHYYNWMKKNKMYVVKSGIQPPEPMARPYNRAAELRQKYGWFQIHKEGIWYGRYIVLEGKNKMHYRIYGNPRDADNYK